MFLLLLTALAGAVEPDPMADTTYEDLDGEVLAKVAWEVTGSVQAWHLLLDLSDTCDGPLVSDGVPLLDPDRLYDPYELGLWRRLGREIREGALPPCDVLGRTLRAMGALHPWWSPMPPLTDDPPEEEKPFVEEDPDELGDGEEIL